MHQFGRQTRGSRQPSIWRALFIRNPMVQNSDPPLISFLRGGFTFISFMFSYILYLWNHCIWNPYDSFGMAWNHKNKTDLWVFWWSQRSSLLFKIFPEKLMDQWPSDQLEERQSGYTSDELPPGGLDGLFHGKSQSKMDENWGYYFRTPPNGEKPSNSTRGVHKFLASFYLTNHISHLVRCLSH